MQGENILLEEIAKLKSMVRNTEKAYQERRSTNMQGENILLEEIAKLKSMLRNTEKARLCIEQTGAVAALDAEVVALRASLEMASQSRDQWRRAWGVLDHDTKRELDQVKFELMQMKRRVLVADANTNVHPSWETAPHKEILDAFKFQGAMTHVLLIETDQQRTRIGLLKDAIRGMMSYSGNAAWEIGDLALNTDKRMDVW